MKRKTEFQNFIIKVTESILKDEVFIKNWNTPEYKKFLGENLRRYSEFTKDHKNIVRNIGRLRENCRFTEDAVSELAKLNSTNWNSIKNNIHQEHILPISEAIRQLVSISENPKREKIEEIFDKLELIVISEREHQLLDGKNGMGLKSKGEPEERLKAIGAQIHKDYENNSII